MAARKRNLKVAEVAAIGKADPTFTNHPAIVFTKHDANGLHFPHENAFIMKLTVARCFVKRILIDIGSSVDKFFCPH